MDDAFKYLFIIFMYNVKILFNIIFGGLGATIAQWICLRLPSCRSGSSPKHTIYAFYSQILHCICHCVEKRTKIKTKRGRVWSIFKTFFVYQKRRFTDLTSAGKILRQQDRSNDSFLQQSDLALLQERQLAVGERLRSLLGRHCDG